MRRSRSAFACMVAAVALLLLGGCTVQARTDLTVTSPQSADIVVSARFTGEAAEVLTKGSDARLELLDMFAERTGQDPQIEDDGDSFTISSHVNYDALSSVADVVGVEALRLSGSAERTTARVSLRDATALVAAIENGVASQQDAVALREAMVKSTTLVLTVRFPGGLDGSADVSQIAGLVDFEQNRTQFTLVRSLDEAGAGELVLTGDPTRDLNVPLLVVGTLVLAGAVLAVVAGGGRS